ncbi:hypothetical protein D3C81_2014470 [compost metagenome]
MTAFVGNRQQAIGHIGHALGIAPTHQGHLAQHIALKAQFHQGRVLAHDGEQGLGLGVVGHIGRLVLLHAW